VLVALLYPKYPFFLILISVAVALLAVEWAYMTVTKAAPRVAITVTAAVLIPVFLAYRRHFLAGLVAAAIGAAAVWLAARRAERPFDATLGVAYIAFPCLALMWMWAEPHNVAWTLLLFAVTWSADIFAYAVGNILKGPKLWPRLSPNKTWSGFVGGLLGATGAAVLMGLFTAARLTVGFAVVVGLSGGLATMAGDLWESMLKRRYGVKDSGDLIPGHGGLLDRVDGLMFAILAVAGARLAHQIGWAQ
jgi:phosphatidate cytidylyltransferase